LLNHISLFSGIGGIDLAAHWAGFQTIQLVERDPFCQKVLQKNFPGVPIHGDITTFDATGFRGRTHLVSGGFPCQPFSHAGKRRGKEDDRHLWPEMLRVIAEAQPTFVLGENVAGFVNLALDDCLFDLEAQGYEAWAFVLPACAVTALHRRDRCFIVARHVAYAMRSGGSPEPGEQQEERPEIAEGSGSKDVAYTKIMHSDEREDQPQRSIPELGDCGSENVLYAGCESGAQEGSSTCPVRARGHTRHATGRNGGGSRPINNWLVFEPELGRSTDGISSWVDGSWEAGLARVVTKEARCGDHSSRLKSLGNAVVPQQVYPILKAIAEELHA
jgi:DNA (cytosine-5)-methyltransferase 1